MPSARKARGAITAHREARPPGVSSLTSGAAPASSLHDESILYCSRRWFDPIAHPYASVIARFGNPNASSAQSPKRCAGDEKPRQQAPAVDRGLQDADPRRQQQAAADQHPAPEARDEPLREPAQRIVPNVVTIAGGKPTATHGVAVSKATRKVDPHRALK